MALRYVSVWNGEHGWQPTTAEAIAASQSGRRQFRCEICGQVAEHRNGEKNRPCFAHYRNSNPCVDKMTSRGGNGYSTSNPLGFSLPFRVRICGSDITASIGFLPMALDDGILPVKIFVNNQEIRRYTDPSRFSPEKTTYLSVGDALAEQYQLSYNEEKNFKHYWPLLVDGVSQSGTLFRRDGDMDDEETITIKRLPRRANVVVGKEYMLFSGTKNLHTPSDVTQSLYRPAMVRGGYWIHRVMAMRLSWDADAFFRFFDARLTDLTAELTEIYPFAARSPLVLIHTAEQVWFYKSKGDIAGHLEVFPQKSVTDQGQQIFAVGSDLQQILSVSRFEGRTSVLRYLMLRKVKEIPYAPRQTFVQVFDERDNEIKSGDYATLPAHRTLSVRAEFDGHIDVLKDGFLINRISIDNADSKTHFDVEYNRTYRIYQGGDRVFELSYHSRRKSEAFNDEVTLQKLKTFKGQPVPIVHTFGAIAVRLKDMPKTKIWIMRQLHLGVMDKQAKDFIQQIVREVEA